MTNPQKLTVDAVRYWIASILSKNNLLQPDGRRLFSYDLDALQPTLQVQ